MDKHEKASKRLTEAYEKLTAAQRSGSLTEAVQAEHAEASKQWEALYKTSTDD
jgi:hypothetical protein